jgi:hypothetical protein
MESRRKRATRSKKRTGDVMAPMRKSAGLALCLAVAALFSGAAQAQVTSAQQNAIKSNCRSDFMSKCSGVTPGGKDALACLQKNVATLSPGCKTAVSATLPPPAPAAAAPAAPAAPAAAAPPPPAPPVTPAATTPAAPVRSAPPPKAKVAPAPRRAAVVAPVAAAPAAPVATAPAAAPTAAQQAAMKQNCRNDFTRHCRGVPPGGQEALGCLQKNVGALSGACKSVVSATLGAPAPAATPAAVTTAPPESRMPKAPVANAAVMLRACKLDLVRHCRGVEPGGGRALACLSANEANLTVRCRTAMKVTSPLR